MRNVKPVSIAGNVLDGKHIYIQSMLSAPSYDINANVEQAVMLENAGCEIVRVSIPDKDALKLIDAIKQSISIPLVADIHFDYKLAIEAAQHGIDKIRINPGNIGDKDRIKAVADICRQKNIPIRIGVNGGSLEKDILEKYTKVTPQALVESAKRHIALLNQFDFDDIVISIKSSNVQTMIESYRLMASQTQYPLHLGVTEAGTERMGVLKSAIGIGSLLADEIGETIRVSLTSDPVKEIYAAKDILKALGKTKNCEVISCPTCGRTRIDIVKYANMIENAVKDLDKNIKIAVMGCVVNGIGEGKEADIGIAGGDGCAVLFKHGEIIGKIDEKDIVPAILKEIEAF